MFSSIDYTQFGMKNVSLEKVVIQNGDHLDIKTISDCSKGGLNGKVPLHFDKSQLEICSVSYQPIKCLENKT